LKRKAYMAKYSPVYRAKNHKRLLRQKRAYSAANRERIAEAASQYYYANRKQVLWRQQMAYQVPAGRARYLWSAARNRAKRKGVPFSLSHEDIEKALLRGRCQVTGLPFTLQATGGQHPFSPTLHRVNPAKGYTRRNTKLVIWAFNAACCFWGEKILWQVVAARWPERIKEGKW